ncbi:MAG: 50S ribosomal protein L4 [Clostridia bacterium]|nr:50S ribosomal protein L4 [Clostridia bacterium]
MSKAKVYDMSGKVIEEIELDENIFGIEPNVNAMHFAVKSRLANLRQGTHSTKVKSEVSGGGKKPLRQKGTGNARQGSTRSAQWIHGGIIFGPKPRNYRLEIPKKLKRLALKSSLSSKAQDEAVIVIDKLELSEAKTKKMAEILKNIGAESALVVTAEKDENVVRATNNIKGALAATVGTINTYDILKYEKFVVTREALSKVSEVYA